MEDEINKFLDWLEKNDLEICRFDGNEFINEGYLAVREEYFAFNKKEEIRSGDGDAVKNDQNKA